jgi:ketosteroid isomerase-like protein
MEPRDEICQLIYTYAERIDAGDFAGVGHLLGDATLTFEGYDLVVTGPDAIEALYASTTRRFDDGTPKTKHVMTNVIVEVDGDHATSRSYYTVLQSVPGELALQPVIAGRYRDAFVNDGGRWRFSAMHVIVDLVGDLRAHLLKDI